MTQEMPFVDFSDEPYTYPYIHPNLTDSLREKLTRCIHHFADHGAVLLKNVFDPNYVEALHSEFCTEYADYFENRDHEDALKVGDKRFMVTVKVKGNFNSPSFYANSTVIPIVRTILGNRVVLNGIGGVVSLPGSKPQHPHQDTSDLYPEDFFHSGEYDSFYEQVPPYCISAILPMVPINSINGCTEVWLGSHKIMGRIFKHKESAGTSYETEVGDLMLMDYRIAHRGQANKSNKVRPIIYNVYARPWFRDYQNYSRQKSVVICKSNDLPIPDEYKHLFVNAEYI